MKARYWAMIIAGVIVLGLGLGVIFTRGGEKPWVSRAPAKSKGIVRIASFNVDGLFDPDDDPSLSGPNDDTPSDQSHLDAIASAIRAVDADILALEGVESLDAVTWFNRTYLSSLGYEHIESLDVGHPKGIENAVLSRYPITDSWVGPDLRLGGTHPARAGGEPNPMAGRPMKFRRSPLMVTVAIPDEPPLTLFVVEHKGGNRYDYWRKAEAEVVVELCQEIGLNRRIIILGSFHSDPDDPSLRPYFDAGFFDPFATGKESEFHATEITGDRTDFILANRAVGRNLDPKTGFVLGGELAEHIRSGEAQLTHLPVVIGLRTGSD